MEETMKLYDMDNSEWRQVDFKKGDRWRSKQVYKCEICGCETNEFVMMQAFWGGGPRLVCPGRHQNSDLHNLLQEKVVNSRQKEHPKKYIEYLLEEIDELRRQFQDVPPNVEGIEGKWEAIHGRFY